MCEERTEAKKKIVLNKIRSVLDRTPNTLVYGRKQLKDSKIYKWKFIDAI